MTAEIQVFLLCVEIVTTDERFGLRKAALNELVTNVFPAEVQLRYFMQLQNETGDAIPDVDFEIRIHNRDGQLTFGPLTTHVAFTGDDSLGVASGLIASTFPAPDEYTVTARILTDGQISEFQYDLDVRDAEAPESEDWRRSPINRNPRPSQN